jgi:hypothetical protein
MSLLLLFSQLSASSLKSPPSECLTAIARLRASELDYAGAISPEFSEAIFNFKEVCTDWFLNERQLAELFLKFDSVELQSDAENDPNLDETFIDRMNILHDHAKSKWRCFRKPIKKLEKPAVATAVPVNEAPSAPSASAVFDDFYPSSKSSSKSNGSSRDSSYSQSYPQPSAPRQPTWESSSTSSVNTPLLPERTTSSSSSTRSTTSYSFIIGPPGPRPYDPLHRHHHHRTSTATSSPSPSPSPSTTSTCEFGSDWPGYKTSSDNGRSWIKSSCS